MLFADATADAIAAAAKAQNSADLSLIIGVVIAVIGVANNWINRRYDKDVEVLKERMTVCEQTRAAQQVEITNHKAEIIALKNQINTPKGTP